MFLNLQLEELTKKLLEALPIDLQNIEDETKQKIKMVLQATLSKLDLVNREEFDVQSQVLAKTREKIEVLEKQIAEFIEKHPKN
jgi:BMFP domain-containing protein YqiC